MFEVYELFVIVVILTGLLAGISVWSRRQLRLKIASLALALAFLPVAYAAMTDLLSRPKPVRFEWWQSQAEEAEVIAGEIVEDQAIHLWLKLGQGTEPRAYTLPWNRELAQNLQEALKSGEQNDTAVRMRNPFEPSWDDGENPFYALPQPTLPPKHLLDPPEQYERPSTAA